MMPVLDLNHLLEISIKSSTLFLTNSLDWFQSLFIIIVVGHPQQAPLWWKIAAARTFIVNRGIVTATIMVAEKAALQLLIARSLLIFAYRISYSRSP